MNRNGMNKHGVDSEGVTRRSDTATFFGGITGSQPVFTFAEVIWQQG